MLVEQEIRQIRQQSADLEQEVGIYPTQPNPTLPNQLNEQTV